MKIIVTGAGLVGLATAMLLARDGHQVTVLERDAAPVPDPEVAWDDWERRGVNQVRLPHLFAPRFRTELEAELPDVVTALLDAGALRIDLGQNAPPSIWGEPRPGDEEFVAVTGRRIVFESVLARSADETPGVEVRRGNAVSGLLAGASDSTGVLNVVGVRLQSGEELPADLVVDATGRRSPVPTWLDALGCIPPVEQADDSGFVYYGRHFHSTDGSLPDVAGLIPLAEYGSISLLTLPADNETWSTTIVASSEDTALRGVRDPDRWNAVVRSLPNGDQWIDGEPLEDRIMSIAKIEDRSRALVVDGNPIVTGLLLVGDSWACTNPSVGRGASIGLVHATGLRDLLRNREDDPPVELAKAWNDTTATLVAPWYEATVTSDRRRLAEIRHLIAGESYAPDDPAYEMGKALVAAAARDPDCARALFRIASVHQLPEQALATEGVFEKVIELGSDWRDQPSSGPSREQLVALANG